MVVWGFTGSKWVDSALYRAVEPKLKLLRRKDMAPGKGRETRLWRYARQLSLLLRSIPELMGKWFGYRGNADAHGVSIYAIKMVHARGSSKIRTNRWVLQRVLNLNSSNWTKDIHFWREREAFLYLRNFLSAFHFLVFWWYRLLSLLQSYLLGVSFSCNSD